MRFFSTPNRFIHAIATRRLVYLVLLLAISSTVWASGWAPFAREDAATVSRGGTVSVLDDGATSVLDNDFDIEGDPLTAFLTRDVKHGELTLTVKVNDGVGGGGGGAFGPLLILCLLMLASTASARPQQPLDELKACAKLNELDARVTCYEELGQRLLAEESAATSTAPTVSVSTKKAAPAAVAVTSTPQLSDELGGEEYEKKADPEDMNNQGLITGCKKGPDKKWQFYFENGQVWRQVDDRRLSLKTDCRMLATITKDIFGFKMEVEGLKGNIRISRRN